MAISLDSLPGASRVAEQARSISASWDRLSALFAALIRSADPLAFDWNSLNQNYVEFSNLLQKQNETSSRLQLQSLVDGVFEIGADLESAKSRELTAGAALKDTRRSLNHRKLLDFFIEEQEDKVIDLLEGTRSHIAQMDNYLKRLMIALEDDFNTQFYDPAFVRIRSASRQWDVTLGQVERTNILTNNRAFAKVTPQATMEFDLPKRNIAIVEAFDGAKALLQDYGALANDPTFLAAAQLMGAGVPNGKVQNLYPSLPTNKDESQLGLSEPPPNQSGSALQNLVPDPSVYKFETGTGFEIRPVIQPDGHSIVYDFNYMYTTDIREPVQADEKHLGRIKRHYIDTQVQTTSFEMREISRYQVALKAARTSQGVPLLQDIPVVGLAFRPLPSAESSIQQNIILGRSVVYPTLYDIMGLRWAPSVVDLNHISVRDSEHIVRGRYTTVRDAIDQISKERFDDLIDIPHKEGQIKREDLYYRQRLPSPYHPGGYQNQELPPENDPTGRRFDVRDLRPPEMRDPPYDRKFRNPIGAESGGLDNLGSTNMQPGSDIPMGWESQYPPGAEPQYPMGELSPNIEYALPQGQSYKMEQPTQMYGIPSPEQTMPLLEAPSSRTYREQIEAVPVPAPNNGGVTPSSYHTQSAGRNSIRESVRQAPPVSW